MDVPAGRICILCPAAESAAAGSFPWLSAENGSENRKSLLHILSRRLKGSAMLLTGS